MPELNDTTKEIFDVGLKEWRIQLVHCDSSDRAATPYLYRIIAHDEEEATKMVAYCEIEMQGDKPTEYQAQVTYGTLKVFPDLGDATDSSMYCTIKPSEDYNGILYKGPETDPHIQLLDDFDCHVVSEVFFSDGYWEIDEEYDKQLAIDQGEEFEDEPEPEEE